MARLREGDDDAFAALYRSHRPYALVVARALVGPSWADDVVAESFTALLGVIRAGRGPSRHVRAYLLTIVRRVAWSTLRSQDRVRATDLHRLDGTHHDPDVLLDEIERHRVLDAFAALPARWQKVLWHIEVLGASPAELADVLGISPNAVSSLARRARQRLRHAYLRHHGQVTTEP